MPKVGIDTIIWDHEDWISGLNPQHNTANDLRAIKGLINTTSFDPYRPVGVASAGFLPADVTNVSVVTDYLRNAVVNGTNAYIIGNNARLYELSISGNGSLTNNATFPRAITSGSVGQDIVTYFTGTTRYAFYSYYTATEWNIGRYDFATTFTDSFMGTNLGGTYHTDNRTYPHPLTVGDDDIMYIGDRNFVHAYDRAGAGTWTAAVVTLPRDFVITSFAKSDTHLVIFAYKETPISGSNYFQSEAKAFFYPYAGSKISFFKNLDDNYVSAAFEFGGTVGCFTQGRARDMWAGSTQAKATKLKLYIDGKFRTVAAFDGAAPIVGGVDVVDTEIFWNSAGTVFSWGERIPGLGNKLNKLAAGAGTTSGLLKTLSTVIRFISSGSTTSGGLQRINDNYAASASVRTLVAKPKVPAGFKAFGKELILHLYANGTTGQRTLQINLEMDGSGSSSEQVAVGATDNFSNLITHYFSDTSGNPFSDFDYVGLLLSWAAGGGGTAAPRVDHIKLKYGLRKI